MIFCGTTLVFFSISESKLAPYILPLFPPLAAIVGVQVSGRSQFIRRVALVTGVLLPLLAVGLWVYAIRRFGFMPESTIPWLITAVITAAYVVVATWKRDIPLGAAAWATAAGAILGWQCLLSAYTELPERSSYKLVMTVKPLIGPQTELFTVGQYRETLSPYLGRTLTPVEFEGELAFGISQQPGVALTAEEFLARWKHSTNAVAFIPPALIDTWRNRGLQGRVIGGDNQTLVVSRL